MEHAPTATFLLFVKLLDGRTLALDVAPHETVPELKDKIHATINIRPSQQRLVFSGKNIDCAHTLDSCGIQASSSVWMMVREVVG